MTDAEVMTTVSVAALDYGGNLEKARRMPQTEGYFPNMLGKSRFKSGIFYLTCSKEDCLNGVEIYDDLRLTQRVIGYIPIGEECQSKAWYDGSSARATLVAQRLVDGMSSSGRAVLVLTASTSCNRVATFPISANSTNITTGTTIGGRSMVNSSRDYL